MPILMYHELGEVPHRLYVGLSEWEAHLDFLAREGYTTITLAQLYRHMTSGEPLPEKPVVITFDDSYASFYEHAFPRLRERGFVATLFVITDLVNHPRHVTWEQLREMAAAGIEIGAHSATHPNLREVDAGRLEQEVAGSRRALEEQLGMPILFFSYPGGSYDEKVLAAVKAAGYLGAVTVASGAATPEDDPFQWPRVTVYRGTTPEKLQALIDAALARSGG
ncbi:MAG: polysaccharide deacetylase family protein [Bacillota bacterium]|nr:MAG: polysaccharide deacetylase [Bacillota bacterium]